MKNKKIISYIVSALMVFSMAINVYAATHVDGNLNSPILVKTPTAISYGDLSRFRYVASKATGKTAKILNATRVNGSNTTWAMRICYDNYDNPADYIVTVLPYAIEKETGKDVSLPFNTLEEGAKIYGKSYYYFVLYDNEDKGICGYAVAERIRRFPNFHDNTFSGTTKRNISYSGVYEEPSSYNFMEEHTK